MKVSYKETDDPCGVAITDQIKQRRLQVVTDAPVSPTPTNPESFEFPVDKAFTIEASELSIARAEEVYIRSECGTYDGPVSAHTTTELEANGYSLDISAPVKLYWQFEGAPNITKGADSTRLSFTDPTVVEFGVRTYHKHPAGSITTTEDPDDVMQSLSTLSSALKTTASERSYPTLRGHPPLVELGDELDIPRGFSPPDTGVEIVIPPEFDYIYPATPLAFYLGANLVPGNAPTLRTERFEHDLATGHWFEDDVADLLKRMLFLDCIVRTEGIHQVDLYERKQIEPELPFDIASMYGRPLSEQLEAYLAVPQEVVEPHLPRWCLTAHLPNTPDQVSAIPHIVNDLGVIRSTRGQTRSVSRTATTAGSATRVRRSARNSAPEEVSLQLIEPEVNDESIEHAWFGDQLPMGASKASVDSFEHQLEQGQRSESINITVVCNDPRMLDEQVTLDDVYGDRDDQPYNIDSHFGVPQDELAELLTENSCDFLHYIGHATPTGLRCTDGELDVRELETVGVNVFLLNACRSFEQAEALVEKGSFGGVATLGDVVNEHAVEIGHAVAHFLNLGFPLRAAIELVHEHTHIGEQYLVVGDGSVDVVQSDGGPPMVCHVESGETDTFELSIQTYPTKELQLGSRTVPTIDSVEEYYLLPGRMKTLELEEQELVDYLTWTISPVEFENELYWNNTIGTVNFQ
ncbi:hypothetical protein [Haloarchaeobius salinus]|uniref:hypothetical protein n=1 Tax=Haloarchaeobius salinus TaxID=1198298 RepID=UPI00210A917B|nr:hypothetical protein [Haloarchaeobius salinus]